jgi:hypothetical protein
MEVIYLNLGRLSIAVGILSALAHVVHCLFLNRPPALNDTLGKMLAGFALPPALAMGLAAFDPPDLLGCIFNLEIYILVGAMSVIWIVLSILFPGGLSSKWIQILGERFGRKP